MKKTLFLNPPSFEGFDGGAGSRYQARREVKSFWYPTWLAQSAALVPGSRLIDAPARGLKLADILPLAKDYELVILHTSTPSFGSDVRTTEALKTANPALMIGIVGPHVAVMPEASLMASAAIDFVTDIEYEYTLKEVAEGRPLESVDGLSFKRDGQVVRNRPRPIIEDLDELPHVVDVYRRDLVIEDYFGGYLLYPYVSVYGGRGCKSRCTYCLWPQTISGHNYRVRSPQNLADEVAKIKQYWPKVREIFFDDDTFTDNTQRAEAVARLIGPMGVTWSCTAKPNVPYETLKVMRENGLRLLLVGYESGVQKILNNIKKGTHVDVARRFTADCRKLGITIHGAFIVGLPGETPETIEETMRFALEINPHTIQVSVPSVYPGTELYEQAKANGWLREERGNDLVNDCGTQVCALSYPGLSHEEITAAMERFYKRFYMRPRKIFEMVAEMVMKPEMIMRRLREGKEFFQFLGSKEKSL